MERGTPYVICDTDGHPVDPQEAKTIIAECFTVPPEVRARRRSKWEEGPQERPLGTIDAHAQGGSTRGAPPQQSSALAS